jgi:ComF family protein
MRIETFSRLINRLPSQCQICHSWPANTVCDDCVSQFAQPHARCQTCALPVPQGMPHCGACLKQAPPLDQCLAAVAYAYPWSNLMAEFKFRDQTGLARVFATLLKATPWVEPALEGADMVLAMPLSGAKLRQRGYNQALLLARELNHTKVQTDILLRIQDSPAQHTLKRTQRLNALKHAFAVDPLRIGALQGTRVVLVDDVMTTGASLYAAARVLRAAGASHITGLVFARTE